MRILHTLLSLISKHLKCDKFEVNTHSVAYLAGKKRSGLAGLGLGPLPAGSHSSCPLSSSAAHRLRGGQESLQPQAQEVPAHL